LEEKRQENRNPSRGSQVEHTDRRLDLESALRELNDRDRSIVILWAQGYTQQEIAKECGVTQRTISRWLQKSVSKMRGFYPFNGEGST